MASVWGYSPLCKKSAWQGLKQLVTWHTLSAEQNEKNADTQLRLSFLFHSGITAHCMVLPSSLENLANTKILTDPPEVISIGF